MIIEDKLPGVDGIEIRWVPYIDFNTLLKKLNIDGESDIISAIEAIEEMNDDGFYLSESGLSAKIFISHLHKNHPLKVYIESLPESLNGLMFES